MKRIVSLLLVCAALTLSLGICESVGAQDSYYDMPVYTGRKWESDYEMRTWKLRRNVAGFGRQFEAAFIGIAGFDTSASSSYVVFVKSEGEKRALPLSLFSAEDQEYALTKQQELIEKTFQERVGNELPTYLARPTLDTGATNIENPRHPGRYGSGPWDIVPEYHEVDLLEGKYFRFISGRSGGSRWNNEEFRENTKEYFDWLFEFIAYELGAPGPYGDEDVRYKTDVVVTDTGFGGGWAFGGSSMWLHSDILHPGSGYIPHEFAHVVQHYSGGLRSPRAYSGFGETHAQWVSHQFSLGEVGHVGTYADRSNYHLSSPRMIYWSWIFMQAITEHPDLGPDYPIAVYYESNRNNSNRIMRNHGNTQEDPLQAFMRLGYEKGAFKHPEKGFGDVIGEMAAKNATWDYVFRYLYQSEIKPTRYNRTLLMPVPDREGWFAPMPGFLPQQYGYNVIELVIDNESDLIEINFDGIEVEDGADWRATLVVGNKNGSVRYSKMINSGYTSIELREGDNEAYLTVAATPSVYRPVEVNRDFRSIVKYPYEVEIKGATPAAYLPDYLKLDHLIGIMGDRHPNGGGFVARSARVDESVYVGKNAVVFGAARITGNARIEDYAIVMDSARVGDNAIIAGNAIVRDHARVMENAYVRDAEVRGGVTVAGNARVLEGVYVEGSGRIEGNATLRDRGYVYTSSGTNQAHITGSTIIGLNSEFRPWTNNPVTDGIFYDLTERASASAGNTKGMYAHWDFNTAIKEIVRDNVYYSDGILRGNPDLARIEGRGVLVLNGNDQYVLLERSVAEFRELTIEMVFNWAGGEANQRVFDFSSGPESGMYLIPENDEGYLEFTIKSNGKQYQIVGTEALATNKWVTVEVEIMNQKATLIVDNHVVGEVEVGVTPVELLPVANYIGRSFDGKYFLKGMIDDFKVYAQK
ncbi:MAG: hypothetical protein GX020_05965 [Firmicutes bacterium]|nr:hypothetical protein [Bacillota bacterium]